MGGLSISWKWTCFIGFGFVGAHVVQAAPANILWSPGRMLTEAPFDLILTTDPPGEPIVFTTDGSAPSAANGEVYTAPLRISATQVIRAATIDPESGESNIETHTYLFTDQVADQEAHPEGYPTEIISRRRGPSRPHTFDWAMDPEVLEDTQLNGHLTDHLKEIATLSLVMDVADLNFMFENQTERGVAFERPVSLELIYPDRPAFDAFKGTQIDCGIRIQGGGAGDQARKKSFRILFKKIYGEGTLNYPLFESAVHFGGNAARRFEGVVLRAGGNTNWSKDDAWKHEPSTYLRDPLVRDSQIAATGIGSRSAWVHLYINGYYFGLYNIAERPDEKFAASYLGGDPADYYAINHGGTVAGEATLWNQVMASSNLRDLELPENYDRVRQQVDIEALCDYLLLNWLVGMGDWPHNNFYGGMANEPPGKMRFFSWDSEYAFWTLEGYLGSNPTAWVHPAFDANRNELPTLWKALAENDDFLMTFADRVYRQCFNNGPLSDAHMQARFQRLAQAIENAIVAESARWGDSSWGREDDPHTRAGDFIPNRDDVLELMNGNAERFVTVLRERGFYPELDPPTLPIAEAPVTAGFAVEMSHPNAVGEIYYTLDGSDPRAAGGMIAPTALLYREGLTNVSIEEATHVQARVMVSNLFGEVTASSALHEQFYVDASTGFPLRITELMYHPETGEALEFIEIKNLSKTRLDLNGFYLTGVDFRFPPDSWAEPEQVIILIPNDDPEAFKSRYPEVAVFGSYRGHLANGGEVVSLRDPQDTLITSVTYDDDAAGNWPQQADGLGASLELADPTLPINAPRADQWQPSTVPGGTPGEVTLPQPTLDSDGDGFTDSEEAVAATDPRDPSSFLKLTIERSPRPGNVRLSFRAKPNRAYIIQSANVSGENPKWSGIQSFAPQSQSSMNAIDVEMETNTRFFRLSVETR